MAARDDCFTAFNGDRFLGVGGCVLINRYRAQAWVLLKQTTPADFVGLHRAVRKVLDDSPAKRIEAIVDPTFDEGVRWIKMLGFKCESPYKPFYFPDGRAASEWVRLK